MGNTIDFGIDLGTTNSAIAKFVKGEVTIFTNPQDYGRTTLPSLVSYRKDKVIVGSKAKEMFEKQSKDAFTQGFFKRKIGTSESFKIKSLNKSVTPIELSAMVLKELKTFVNTGDILDAAVITIPASFDTIQSNATKEAGIQAGFKQVVLLQEPIAASLAYANLKKTKEMVDGKWLVYDLGGGTFDVALIQIKDGEMKVLDHEGNNFLGGTDFDRMIVEKIFIPKICEQYSFSNFEADLKSASGKYNAKYYVFLHRAEEAKVLLSAQTTAEITIDGFEDEQGKQVDMEITVTRSEFNELIRASIDDTVSMIKEILTRNSLNANELLFTLMVGGSTYIPYVRNRVEERLQIPANWEIDPTTAVAVGAAYYAATKQRQLSHTDASGMGYAISVKPAYQNASREKEELFAARVTGDLTGLSYRITREDGGFDTGFKKLRERITEDLPLVEDAYNFFKLTVYDDRNNVIETGMDIIGINSGFGISGQPLPDDICLEVDDYDNPGATKLQLVFQKNTILPAKRKLTYCLNKTVLRRSDEQVIRINVLEGSHLALPEANKGIGFMTITGSDIARDIMKGSDIELTVSVSESRDLTIAAYLNMADQEFQQTFVPKERHTSIEILQLQASDLSEKLSEEIEQATKKEDYETANTLTKLKAEMAKVNHEVEDLSTDDSTDNRYKLEDRKRKIAQELDNATKHKRLQQAKESYFKLRQTCEAVINENGNDHERKTFNDLVVAEATFLTTNSPLKIQERSSELNTIISQINWRTPDFLLRAFNWLQIEQPKMNDQMQAKSLFDAGRLAVIGKSWDRLREVNFGLIDLLPKGVKTALTTKIGFG